MEVHKCPSETLKYFKGENKVVKGAVLLGAVTFDLISKRKSTK